MSIKTRLRSIEQQRNRATGQRVIVVNPLEELTGEELERHRAAVLAVARHPGNILVCRPTPNDPDPLLALLGPAAYATLPKHRQITIQRAYGNTA